MSIAPTPQQHISSSPDICGGRPVIAGTRIRVHDIYVWHELQGLSPDQIVHEFPQLTLADVYAALSYFWENRDTLLAQMEADRKIAKVSKQQHAPLLQEKLRAMRDNGHSLPS